MIKTFMIQTYICDLCGSVSSTTTESSLYDRIVTFFPKGWVNIEGITHCNECFQKHADEIKKYDISYLDKYKTAKANPCKSGMQCRKSRDGVPE